MAVILRTFHRVNRARVGYIPSERESLTANRIYYVRTDGNDANNGLSNTSAGAFATIQYAVDRAVNLDPMNYSITIQIGDGTYDEGFVYLPWHIGSRSIILQGNETTIGAVVIQGSTNHTIFCEGWWTIRHVEVKNVSAGYSNVYAQFSGFLSIGDGVQFGSTVSNAAHIIAYYGASIFAGNSDIRISGNAITAIQASYGSFVDFSNTNIVFVGSRTFSSFFVYAGLESTIRATGFTWSGTTPTTTRYRVGELSTLTAGNASATYFPGTIAGSVATGGLYI
jgi:hypothetical protein